MPVVARSKDNQRLVEYVTKGPGTNIYNQIVALNKAKYPDVHAEIEGLAHGAGVDVDALLTINLSDILSGFFSDVTTAPKVRSAKQCTDVHAIKESFQGWAHNEDELPQPYYLVYSNITRTTAKVAAAPEVYVGFAYAGVVVGWAWGFNTRVGQSINAIPIDANATTMGVSINYVGRDALRATTTADAVARTSVTNQATAAHFNFGSYVTPSVHVSVETAPSNASGWWGEQKTPWQPVSTKWINASTLDANMGPGEPTPGHYMHVNLYRRLDAPTTPFGPSSSHRMARIKALPPPDTKHDLLAMLSDTFDAKFPVWRSANDYDHCSTLATVLFDTGAAEITIFGKQPIAPNPLDVSLKSRDVLIFDWKRPELWEGVLRAS